MVDYLHYKIIFLKVNPTITQDELVDWCDEHGVIVMAYSPFGGILGRKSDAPPPRTDHPILKRIAAKCNKTVPQILLRYLVRSFVKSKLTFPEMYKEVTRQTI